MPSQHLRLGEAHPAKKRGLRGECWLGSSLAGAGAEPSARSERQCRLHRHLADPRAEVHGVPWPQQPEMGLGRVHRSPAVKERFSSLGCQCEQPDAGNEKMELVKISWVHPKSVSWCWELEEDGPDSVFLCENKVSSEASDAFLGLWRCVACGACKNQVCPCSIEDFRHP